MAKTKSIEQERLEQHYASEEDWLKWGPYLSERQWGTVREDYSAEGDAWTYFPHEHARSRTYRWGEDGLAGISDRYSNICFALALWNGNDTILKERLFGLTGPQGNHGEDVKELYYYLDSTPTHSYLKHLYKYPQARYPYEELIRVNAQRDKHQAEYELLDTGVFEHQRYFDVQTEYAKASPEDLLIRITITNRGPAAAPITVLPTLWCRNLWDFTEMPSRPLIEETSGGKNYGRVKITHPYTGSYWLYFEQAAARFFTENETNRTQVFREPNDHTYKKDLFHDAIVGENWDLATQRTEGTKFAPVYRYEIEGGEQQVIQLRLCQKQAKKPWADFDQHFAGRLDEANAFYARLAPQGDAEGATIQRQALAGMLWTKQYYHFDVETWLKGDPKHPKPPAERLHGRNAEWTTLRNHDILSMPDKWEYPWFAAWDTAFHCLTLARVDRTFAKEQLLLFTREWYMHPNGQIPAYEWDFGDVNPPVHAWATYQVYTQELRDTSHGDVPWLKRMFNKLSLNFTWWVNRKDTNENNIFEGGFLGLDNIGVFDRSKGVPGGGTLDQVDGTAWMALYALSMLQIALEIAKTDQAYEDMATKFLGHFVFIAEALNHLGVNGVGAWDEEEGFFYDILQTPKGETLPIKVRSLVGMLSVASVLVVDAGTLTKLPGFTRSLEWFRKHRRERLKYEVIQEYAPERGVLLSLVPKDRLEQLLKTLLDEQEFLSPYGIRSLSKMHQQPYIFRANGETFDIQYAPAESPNYLFGGNSNWRGPVWFPVNYLFISALRTYHSYCQDRLRIANDVSKGELWDLDQWSKEISRRLIGLFRKDAEGNRPIHRHHAAMYREEAFDELVLFYEYFHGDTGRGVGASHQTGWTGLVANLIEECTK